MPYKVKSAFRPSERRRREPDTIELNVTPIMNLVVVLIPLLLQAVVMVKLGIIDYEPPELMAAPQEDAGEGGGEGGGDEIQLLELKVNVNDSSFEVSIFNADTGQGYWKIPILPEGEYDFAQLQEVLYTIKTETVGPPIRTETVIDTIEGKPVPEVKEIFKMQDADIVRISAVPNVSYQTVISVLDATREITVEGEIKFLFPNQVLGYIAMVGVM